NGEVLPPLKDTPWTRQVWDHDEWLEDAGEFSIVDPFEKEAEKNGPTTTLKWVPRHDIAFFGFASHINNWSLVNELITDPAYDVVEGVPKLGHRVHFGDIINTAAGRFGCGYFFVLPSTVIPDDRWDGVLPSDASRPRFVAVQAPECPYDRSHAVPKCCAPPTFPFSYYSNLRWWQHIEGTHMKDGTLVAHDLSDEGWEWGHQFGTAEERKTRLMYKFGW
ncbi:hypothetical protein HK104_003265, partial [Borealophlyctis nickersoniae]